MPAAARSGSPSATSRRALFDYQHQLEELMHGEDFEPIHTRQFEAPQPELAGNEGIVLGYDAVFGGAPSQRAQVEKLPRDRRAAGTRIGLIAWRTPREGKPVDPKLEDQENLVGVSPLIGMPSYGARANALREIVNRRGTWAWPPRALEGRQPSSSGPHPAPSLTRVHYRSSG